MYQQSLYKKLTVTIILVIITICTLLSGAFLQCSEYPPVTYIPPPPRLQLGTYHAFYGDLHNHTRLSDGTGSPEAAYAYARDHAHLDFFGLSDHEGLMTEESWNKTRNAADAYNENNRYVTFRGFEWSSSIYGHLTIIATEDFCYSENVNDTTTATFQKLCSWLSSRNGVAFFNHPGRIASGAEFDHFLSPPSDRIVGMELWNKGNTFEMYYYNDGNLSNDHTMGYFDEALSHGWKIGPTGGGDNHWASWGTNTNFRIAVLADSLTRDELLNAFRAQRFYTTLDMNVVISFTSDSSEMGSTIGGPTNQFLLRAADGDNESFTKAVLLNSQHDTVSIWEGDTTNLSIAFEYTTTTDDYLYFIIRQPDGDEAITSPLWIDPDVIE